MSKVRTKNAIAPIEPQQVAPVRRARTKSASAGGQINMSLSEFMKFNLDLYRNVERPTRPFAQSDYVFICIDAIIKACRTIKMMLSSGDDNVIESGPVYDLLYNSENYPLSKFISETAGYLALYRECYWVFTEQDGIKPTKMLVAGPEQVVPLIMMGQLVGYRLITVTGRFIPLLVDDVWPILDFNPYPLHRPFHSIGPTEAGHLAISSAYQATLMNEATMANGGKLSGVITTPAGVKLDDEEKAALISQFESRHKGAKNAGKWALATGGIDIKTMSQTLAELQMVDLRKYDATTICALFGVPPENFLSLPTGGWIFRLSAAILLPESNPMAFS